MANRSIDVELTQTLTAGITYTGTQQHGSVTTSLDLSGEATISVGLHVVLEVDFGLTHWPRVEHFEAVAEAVFTADASATVSWHVPRGVRGEEATAHPTPGSYTHTVPRCGDHPRSPADFTASIDLSAALTAAFSTGRRFQVGVRYDRGDAGSRSTRRARSAAASTSPRRGSI